MDRVNELLRREIGGALFRVMTEAGFDLSAVTVTHVITARNLRQARVLVSIRDHQEDRLRMLSLLKQHRTQIQAMINRDLVLKYTPKLQFELDLSLEQGNHILDVLSKITDELGPLEEEEETTDLDSFEDMENGDGESR